jgi:peptide/nickel transport system substrate-binding protein
MHLSTKVRRPAALLAVLLVAGSGATVSAGTAAPKAGAACKTSDSGKTSGSLTCAKNAKGKLVWSATPTTKAPASTSAPAPAPAPAPAAASGPKVGGKMVFAIEAETTSGFTPSSGNFAMSGNIVRQSMIENIIMPNTAGDPQCYLCTAITPNSSYTEWTIKLRDGIEFHNGEAFDAAAVKANFDDLRRAGAPTAALLRPVRSVDVVNPTTVKLSLTEPYVNFPAQLVNTQSAMVAPAQLKDAQGRNKPIGTGPYVFKEWKVNESLTVVRNPKYWRKDVGFLDEITFRVVTEETARVTAFKSGAIQGMMTVNPVKIAELKDLEKDGKAKVTELNKLPGINNVLLNLERFPTSELRVRQAILLATDRAQLNKINNAGLLQVIDVPFGQGDVSKLGGVYPKPDAAKAKALIDAVEKETGKKVELTLHTSAVPENIENAETIRQMWEKAGISVKIAATEQAAYIRQVQIGNFQAATFRQQSNLDPEDTRRFFHSENYAALGTVTANYSRYRNGIMDSAFDQLRTNSDPVVRRRAADTIATQLALDIPMVILAATTWGVAIAPDYQFVSPKLPNGQDMQTTPTGAFQMSFLATK